MTIDRERAALLFLAAIVLAAGCTGGSTAPATATPSDPPAGSPTLTPVASAAPSRSPSSTPSPAPSVDLEAARLAFDYPMVAGDFVIVDETRDGAATIRDVTYESVDGRIVSAFVVVPDAPGPHPAALFLHWLATVEPDGNRTEFVDEAVDLAAEGVVSLLPQQVFPWTIPPSGANEDRQAVIDQVVDLRAGLDILLAQPEVDPTRLAVVGHDFGGMYAALIAALDERVDAVAIAASVPRWADWYLHYWQPVSADEAPAYKATMAEVDPVTFLPIEIPLLLQFSKTDQYVNKAAVDAWVAAADGESTMVETYAWNHSLHTDAVEADRRAFLAAALGFAD